MKSFLGRSRFAFLAVLFGLSSLVGAFSPLFISQANATSSADGTVFNTATIRICDEIGSDLCVDNITGHVIDAVTGNWSEGNVVSNNVT